MVTLARAETVSLARPTLFSRSFVQAALFLVVAIALMATTFGDTNRHADETFYFLVGQRMHEGLLPYVDVWDRKPLGLFLIYYLIAGISSSVLAYQLAASLFAAATAFVVGRIVQFLAGGRGVVMAGLVYLVAICPFEGDSGQSPDFYNLFIALAALLIIQQMERLRRGESGWQVLAAMLLCGLAITIKQTTLFESVFLGLVAVVVQLRAGVPRGAIAVRAGLWVLIGATPMLLIAAFYWQVGHWPEFWHAMVTSNLSKAHVGGEAWRLLGNALRAGLLLIFAAWGLVAGKAEHGALQFLRWWIGAALLGFLSVPNFYGHYMLPLMVPLSVAAGLLLAGQSRRNILFVALLAYSSLWFSPLQGGPARGSIESMAAMTKMIREHDRGGGLLVFDAPPYLYALTGKGFLSPLVFPHHLNHAIENNVSHLDTHAEIDRIIAARPGVIVLSDLPRNHPVNIYSRSKVLAYARKNCPFVGVVGLIEDETRLPMVIFGDCQ